MLMIDVTRCAGRAADTVDAIVLTRGQRDAIGGFRLSPGWWQKHSQSPPIDVFLSAATSSTRDTSASNGAARTSEYPRSMHGKVPHMLRMFSSSHWCWLMRS